MEINKIYHGDSFELINDIPDNSVDLILEDMPYNQTRCEWDVKIDLEKYWESRKKIIKENGVIVLTASQPFTSFLVTSNIELFRYEWIWEKTKSTGFLDCSYRPMRSHENILVFYNLKPTYNPQKRQGDPWVRGRVKRPKSCWGEQAAHYAKNETGERQPKSIILVSNPNNDSLHPTQKPVVLFEYLIKTYTNESDIVFDGFSGSGTTGVAAIRTNRNFICIEKDLAIFQKAEKRIKREQSILKLKLVA